MRCMSWFVPIVMLATAVTLAQAAPAPVVDPTRFAQLEWRLVGPYRGGRVVAVTGVPGHPSLFYMGATGGGVWRTTDAGRTWVSLADSAFGTGSVGAVAVGERSQRGLRGDGRGPIRGNVSHGDGVYSSLDAGRTWKHMGLGARARSRACASTPRNPRSSTSRRSATRSPPTPNAASIARPTAASPGSACSPSTTAPGRATW